MMENLAIRKYDDISYDNNRIQEALEQLFRDMKMDEDYYGTTEWSPFSEFISPGETVVIKPNLVLDMSSVEEQLYTTSNPTIVGVLVNYVWKALKGDGRIVVGDAPSSETDFEKLIDITGYDKMISAAKKSGINVELIDFRDVKVISKDGIWIGEQKNKGKADSVVVRMGEQSQFYGENKKYHGAGYDIRQTIRHHHGEVQEYKVSSIVLDADTVISVPKLKTHRKAGITCCLKNLVGINCDKNYLPHFTMGAKNMKGDEMPILSKSGVLKMGIYNLFREYVIAYSWKYIGEISVKVLSKRKKAAEPKDGNVGNKPTVNSATSLHERLSGQPISSGAWQGNETISKMILDLNRIFIYADKNGQMCDTEQRKVFYVVDGIYCGMGNGPVDATPLYAGIVACGKNAASVDTQLLKRLNIEPDCIPLYRRAKDCKWLWYNSTGNTICQGKVNSDEVFEIKVAEPDGWKYERYK